MFRNLAPLLRKPSPRPTVVADGAAGPLDDSLLTEAGASRVVTAYQRLAPALHRYLYVRTGSAEDADDLVMEVFVQAWRHRFTVEKPEPWLFTVARHAADRFGKRLRRDASLDDVATVAATETRWDDHDPGSPVIVAFFAMREADREILLLHGYEERPIAEVAAALGISEMAAWKRWDRARTRFYDVLLAVGVTPPNTDRWARAPDRAGGARRVEGGRHDDV